MKRAASQWAIGDILETYAQDIAAKDSIRDLILDYVGNSSVLVQPLAQHTMPSVIASPSCLLHGMVLHQDIVTKQTITHNLADGSSSTLRHDDPPSLKHISAVHPKPDGQPNSATERTLCLLFETSGFFFPTRRTHACLKEVGLDGNFRREIKIDAPGVQYKKALVVGDRLFVVSSKGLFWRTLSNPSGSWSPIRLKNHIVVDICFSPITQSLYVLQADDIGIVDLSSDKLSYVFYPLHYSHASVVAITTIDDKIIVLRPVSQLTHYLQWASHDDFIQNSEGSLQHLCTAHTQPGARYNLSADTGRLLITNDSGAAVLLSPDFLTYPAYKMEELGRTPEAVVAELRKPRMYADAVTPAFLAEFDDYPGMHQLPTVIVRLILSYTGRLDIHRPVPLGQIGHGRTLAGAPDNMLRFDRPFSCAVIDESIYIVDQCQHRVVVTSMDGAPLREFGCAGAAPGQFQYPTTIATINEPGFGEALLIVDKDNHRLQVITKLGEPIRTFGQLGSDPGQLRYPCTAKISDGEIFVTDVRNDRIQVFALDGTFRRQFTHDLKWPTGLCFYRELVVVADNSHGCVRVFTKYGQFVYTLRNHLTFPNGIMAVDDIFTVVHDNDIQAFYSILPDGTVLDTSGSAGDDLGYFRHPFTLTLHRDILLVPDFHNHRVQILSVPMRTYRPDPPVNVKLVLTYH